MKTPTTHRTERIERLLTQCKDPRTEEQKRRDIETDIDTRNKILYFGELINDLPPAA